MMMSPRAIVPAAVAVAFPMNLIFTGARFAALSCVIPTTRLVCKSNVAKTTLSSLFGSMTTAEPATNSAADQAEAAWEYARSVQWFMDPIFKGHYPQIALDRMDLSRFEVRAGDMEIIHQPLDFLGVNYYFRAYVSTEQPPRQPEAKLGVTDMGWEIYPQGFTHLLIGIHREYKAHGLPPIYITENGVAVADKLSNTGVRDAARIDYLHRHLEAVAIAIAEGVDIRGYFYWSLLDNFEWNSGYLRRFGLVYVDYPTQQRVWKDSAYWYRDWVKAARKI